jgi:hypothetical protein
VTPSGFRVPYFACYARLTLWNPVLLGSLGLLSLNHAHFPLGLWSNLAAKLAKDPLVWVDSPPIHIYAASFV